MAKRYSKAAHSKRRKQTSHVLKNMVILLFCAVGIWFGSSLWHAALTLQTAQPAESIVGEEFRPQVGDPPYRVVIDAGHGGADPGARGVIEEKDMTAATASELIRLLRQDSNFIPLQTRDSFDETAEWKRCPGDDDRYHEDFRGRFICRTFDETTTPAQRAARADEQAPQLLLSIHGNSAANGSTASGFECYPAVPGRTWHQESFYFAQLLAKGMQAAGASLRGRGGVRYIYYLENDQKQLVESTHTEVRAERSFTLLEDVNCPAVLAEQCFVTNEADVAQFGSEEGCKKTARVYYEAICAYFGTQPQAEQLAGFTLN